MRISELSHASGVPIPTIKYYLREGLLPAGRLTAANQASYGDAHARRLRLVRVLVEVGGLSLASVRGVLAALERTDRPLHDTLAAAHVALRREEPDPDRALLDARRDVDAWLVTLGWQLSPGNPARDDLAASLVALRRLGWDVGPEAFGRYASHADALAEAEIAYVAQREDREAAVEATVIGTVLFERAFSALRRLAHEHQSRRQLGDAPAPDRKDRRPTGTRATGRSRRPPSASARRRGPGA